MSFFIYLSDRNFWLYIFKFVTIFCVFYFGTLAVMGLTAPRNLYSGIIDHYLDYVSWLRKSLLFGSKYLLNCFGIETYIANKYALRIHGGRGVKIVYSCLGFGIMSFWIAFIIANKGNLIKKIKWILAGLITIFLINVIRLSLLVVASNKYWVFPFFDHHTWFNLTAYSFVFLMIYFYDKSERHIL